MSQNEENIYDVGSAEQFQQLLSADLERISLLNFWAAFTEPCAGINKVVAELAKKHPAILVLQVKFIVMPLLYPINYSDRLKQTKSRMKISLTRSRSSLYQRV